MIAIDGLVPADICIPESIGFLLVYEDLDILQKRSLIALEGNDVVSLLILDLFGEGYRSRRNLKAIVYLIAGDVLANSPT